ncbi:JAB domain-containing protein [Sphingobacterium multivorum]|uniref:JAB domain-containing protein n=1 Tax=Sphingobacterium multivorum TaxID=28454 RepID=UPI003DA3FE79
MSCARICSGISAAIHKPDKCIKIGEEPLQITIYTSALLCNATRIAVAQNHPSGTLRPSTPDRTLTCFVNKGSLSKFIYRTLTDFHFRIIVICLFSS